MASYTFGSSCPPNSFGHDNPKNPASYSDWCHAACPSQYASSVDDAGRPGSLSFNQSRRRWRNAASSGESPKSMLAPDAAIGQHEVDARTHAAEQIDREQGPAEEHVGEALPGVADAAVHL